jgi:hypothetical protein
LPERGDWGGLRDATAGSASSGTAARTENDEARAKPFFGRYGENDEASRADASHIQAHGGIEPGPAGAAMPTVTALELTTAAALVPRTTAPTARVGDCANVAYAPGGTGQQPATKLMIDSETEAP